MTDVGGNSYIKERPYIPERPVWDKSFYRPSKGGKTNSRRRAKSHAERVMIKARRKQGTK